MEKFLSTGKTARHSMLGGFTLIELMVVVVIVGILATIAYPSYNRYMIQTRRSDAHTALTRIAAAQEKFFTDCNWYATQFGTPRNCGTGPASGVLGVNGGLSTDGHYQLAIVSATATAFTISAGPAPGSPQVADTECTAFTLTSTGAKGALGSNTSRCWRK